MYIFAYAVQPCIQTPDIAQCALRKKKELKEGGGGAGVTDTCFLTKLLSWQIGLKHSQHHKAVADMVLQSNAASSQFPHPFGLFLENKLLESKNKISNHHMLDSPRPSDRVLRCRPSTVQSKWQNRDKPPYRKDFKILHHAQVICMKFTLRPLLLLITTVIIIKTFYHSFLKF